MGREHRIDMHRRRSQYPGRPRASDALFWRALKCQGLSGPRVFNGLLRPRDQTGGCRLDVHAKSRRRPCVVQRLTKYQREAQQIRAGRSCSEFSYRRLLSCNFRDIYGICRLAHLTRPFGSICSAIPHIPAAKTPPGGRQLCGLLPVQSHELLRECKPPRTCPGRIAFDQKTG
jgi:hypothetical protein